MTESRWNEADPGPNAGQGGAPCADDAQDTRPLVALGEALVDLVALSPPAGSLAATETFQRAAGGAPANVAVGAARLGCRSGFVGKVGADPFGDYLHQTLRREGVDVSRLTRAAGARTALAFVALGEGGERDFLFYRRHAADAQLRADELDEEYLAGAGLLHVGSLSLVEEPARSATLRAVEVAARHGVPRSLDPNLRLDLWPSPEAARRAVLELLPAVSILKVSDDELEFLTGARDARAARSLLHEGMELITVTRGAAGAEYVTHTHAGSVPPFAVSAVDTTGAGDAFVAALLAARCAAPALAQDPPGLERALRRANAFAALTVTRRGAIPALPSAAELEAFLARAGGS